MTKEEILQKIGERIAALSHNASQMCEEYEGYRLACLDISDVLDEIEKELSQPSLPSNLDEAAEKFAHFYDNGTCDGVAQECFKAGAEWMAGQGQTFETIMQEDDVDELVPTCPDMYNYGYSCGDKVIVQIRKKQWP